MSKETISRILLVRMKRAVRSNSDRVFAEIRETRTLYDNLLRWSRGQELTPLEKTRTKAQILDVCKTIPALAVFVLPFGSILLVLLIKFLPFNILPSAFGGPSRTWKKRPPED